LHRIKSIVKKELSDHFSSFRFIIIFALITMVSLILVYISAVAIDEDLSGEKIPQFVFLMLFTSSRIGLSLVQFVAFFGPLIGLILGFDTINRERNEGTLSKLLSQPIYRDDVINGKFLAGLCVITIIMVSIILIITGLGLIVVGVKPGIEELWRIIIYLVICIIYVSLWHGVAILFSILFRSVATSALASIAAWIFFSFFLSLGVDTLISAIVSTKSASSAEVYIKIVKFYKTLSFTSPMKLYVDSTATIVDPMRRTLRPFIMQMSMMEQWSLSRFSGPLSIIQSFLMVIPYIIYLMAITVICFTISYIVFMRQEIRSL